MKEEDILFMLELPKSTWVRRTFPFNKLAKQLPAKQRKTLTEGVVSRGIRILATINPNNTNVARYENEMERYEEIHIFFIKLEDLKYAKDVFTILSNIIPYPLMIIFSCSSNYQFLIGDYEKNSKNHYLKLIELYVSSKIDNLRKYLSQISFGNLEKINLKVLYKSYITHIINIELYKKYGINKCSSKAPELLLNLNNLDKEIVSLVNKAKKEKQMNSRIQYQVKASKLKKARKKLLQGEYEND